jgi:hypothetical protein
MRFWWLGALFLLGACGDAGEPAAPAATEPAAPQAKSASAARAAPGDAKALLARLVHPVQQGPYAPRDDCATLPDAAEFRQALAAAALARDVEAVAALALPEVTLGFSGDDGRDRLRAKLAGNEGDLFGELQALLALGCAADAEGGMTMPWYFAQDLGDVDSYSAMLVTGAGVPLHAAADPASPVTQRLSWELVSAGQGFSPDRALRQVTTSGGAQGFVAADTLRSMLDYRLLATKRDGRWRVSAIVAGD